MQVSSRSAKDSKSALSYCKAIEGKPRKHRRSFHITLSPYHPSLHTIQAPAARSTAIQPFTSILPMPLQALCLSAAPPIPSKLLEAKGQWQTCWCEKLERRGACAGCILGKDPIAHFPLQPQKCPSHLPSQAPIGWYHAERHIRRLPSANPLGLGPLFHHARHIYPRLSQR